MLTGCIAALYIVLAVFHGTLYLIPPYVLGKGRLLIPLPYLVVPSGVSSLELQLLEQNVSMSPRLIPDVCHGCHVTHGFRVHVEFLMS